MKSWFEQYDQETYFQPFSSIGYMKFNPKSENETTFKRSYGFDLLVRQFETNFLNNEGDLKKVYDPLSEICIQNVIN